MQRQAAIDAPGGWTYGQIKASSRPQDLPGVQMRDVQQMTPKVTNWITPSALFGEMSICYRWDRRKLNKKFDGRWWLPLQELIAEGKVKATLVGVTIIYETVGK